MDSSSAWYCPCSPSRGEAASRADLSGSVSFCLSMVVSREAFPDLRPVRVQQSSDLIIRGLGEILVPTPHTDKRFWRSKAYDFIGFIAERGYRSGRCDRYRDQDVSRPQLSQRQNGGAHRGAGGDAVIDQDDAAAGHIH